MNLLETKSYSFDLPSELIAAEPLAIRSDSRLLVYFKKADRLEHRFIHELPEILPAHTLMVANNTKVFPARLRGTREGSSGKVEFFLLKKEGTALWQGLMKAAAKIQPGFRFVIEKEGRKLCAEVIARNQTTAGVFLTAKFERDPVDEGFGEVPLPPYIVSKREGSETAELETYNTVYAKEAGSVAAPTAGRHFTPELIARLKEKQIDWAELTLHVGLGTFKPVTTPDIRDHQMHEEMSELTSEVRQQCLDAKLNAHLVLAVGTTSTRTLEGRARIHQGKLELQAGSQPIDLFIHPESGHEFKVVDAMLTNFHLPESTLLMMLSSFVGSLPKLLEIYQVAIKARYRFYSYGDAMLILP